MIIINSEIELEVGKVTKGELTDLDRKWHTVTMLVLRIASKEEYLECTKGYTMHHPLTPYFYEVHMD